VDVDNNGATFITEYGSGAIRRVGSDGVISTVATLVQPKGLIVDGNGIAYVCDATLNSVIRVQPNGVTSTVAGTGNAGSTGLSSTAAAASLDLNAPEGIALAPDGSVYIADTANHAVRHVVLNGQMSTVVGTGISCSSPHRCK
jgi:streptogramin lyase